MSVQLHLVRLSVNCHGPWLALRESGIEFALKDVDLMKGEQKTPEFLKLNPQHTVPTLSEGDYSLWESNAICRYIANKFDGAKKLYPSDPKTRALIDVALDFKQNTLSKHIGTLVTPALGFGAPVSAEVEEKTKDALTNKTDGAFTILVEHFLKGNPYIGGEEPNLADLVIVPALVVVDVLDLEIPAAIQEYRARFTAKLNYQELLDGAGGLGIATFIAMKKKGSA